MSNPRPLSPHLGIYKWRINMLQSSLHRMTGLFLVLGAMLMTWGLIAASASAAAWATFAAFCSSWVGMALLFVWTWSLVFHLCNGIQHLFHDMSLNFGPPVRDRTKNPVYWSTGWIIFGASIVLTLLVWTIAIARMSGGAA